jgi:hypothetical protein
VLHALEQVDLTVMPRDWSWEKAAEAFAAELAEVLMSRGGEGPVAGPRSAQASVCLWMRPSFMISFSD